MVCRSHKKSHKSFEQGREGVYHVDTEMEIIGSDLPCSATTERLADVRDRM